MHERGGPTQKYCLGRPVLPGPPIESGTTQGEEEGERRKAQPSDESNRDSFDVAGGDHPSSKDQQGPDDASSKPAQALESLKLAAPPAQHHPASCGRDQDAPGRQADQNQAIHVHWDRPALGPAVQGPDQHRVRGRIPELIDQRHVDNLGKEIRTH